MDFTFTPTGSQSQGIEVPYYEDARANYAPYYEAGRRKPVEEAKNEVITELAKLGAASIRFEEGFFKTSNDVQRHGFRVLFWYGTREGMLRAAGLPIRGSVTDAKLKKIRVQALLNIRDWAKVAVTAQVFSPGADPLIGHLLVDGQRTVSDYIAEMGQLPQINPAPSLTAGEKNGKGIIEAEFEVA